MERTDGSNKNGIFIQPTAARVQRVTKSQQRVILTYSRP